jgi:hypothetical protein
MGLPSKSTPLERKNDVVEKVLKVHAKCRIRYIPSVLAKKKKSKIN